MAEQAIEPETEQYTPKEWEVFVVHTGFRKRSGVFLPI